mgnify:CR=1 FL=1
MAELSRNEWLKAASAYLRGTIAEGLERPLTGSIAEDDTQLTKFHGLYLQDDRDLRLERRKKRGVGCDDACRHLVADAG